MKIANIAKMIITKYVVGLLSTAVCEAIDWFMEVVGAVSTNKYNGAVVGSSVGSIDGVAWMIGVFVGDTEVESIGKIIGELEGEEVAAFNVAELSVRSIVKRLLHVISNAVDIAIGSSVIIC